MFKFNSRFRNSGFSLFELLFVAATLAVVAALSGGLISNLIVERKRSTFKDEMSILRDSFKRSMEDRVAWNSTLAAYGTTVPNVSTPFTPRDRTGALLYPGYNWEADPLIGFSMDGAVCNQFSQVNPTILCPVRYEFYWQKVAGTCGAVPECDPTNPLPPDQQCCVPSIDIEIRVLTAFPANSPYFSLFSPDSRVGRSDYAMNIRKSRSGSVWESTVNVFSQSAQTATSDPCPTGQTVVGFDRHTHRQCGDKTTLLTSSTPPPPPPPPPGPAPAPAPGPGPGPAPAPAPPPLKTSPPTKTPPK